MFEHVENYLGDPILSLMESYLQDPRPNKVALSIGLYYNEDGNVPILKSVKVAEQIIHKEESPHFYLPMEGSAMYCKNVQDLIFGSQHKILKEERVATIQTIGGSGALKIGADFLKYYFPKSRIWVSDPTWDNHIAIFHGSHFIVDSYPYYDKVNNNLCFDLMIEKLSCLPKNSIILLHPCCHNPTGIDPNNEQWTTIIQLIKNNELIPFIDMAYQGFGSDLDSDAWLIRTMANNDITFLVASSFSKNFSLYGERIGSLSIVCENKKIANCVLGQLKASVRRHYSSPVLYSSKIVSIILDNNILFKSWKKELEIMCQRIKNMRTNIYEILSNKLPYTDFSYFLTQRGMFSFTGLNSMQVDNLRKLYGIYLVRSGRICLSGLNFKNIEYVADCIVKVLNK